MARTVVPLTNTQVNQAKPKPKEYSLSDGRGLALRIKPNGSKLWIFNYTRPHTSKRANLSFGIYPETSLAEARKERSRAREQLAQGIDPKAGRDHTKAEKVRQQATTLEIVSRQWWDLKRRKITPDYADDIINSLEKHVFPKLGGFPLANITAPDVISALQPLVKAGKLEMIKRLCSRLNQIMTYANNSGMVVGNPLAGIRHAFESPTVTNNPTLKPEELSELMYALKHANIRRTTYLLILWQLHTMTRPGEAAGARWDEIDSDKELWVIPENRTKKRRIHIIPLTPQTSRLLEHIRMISGKGEYLFPGDVNPRQPVNNSSANVALKRMGFHRRLTAHGMRSLASTTLNEQGFDSELIEVSLAHIDKNTTRAAYNRADYC